MDFNEVEVDSEMGEKVSVSRVASCVMSEDDLLLQNECETCASNWSVMRWASGGAAISPESPNRPGLRKC